MAHALDAAVAHRTPVDDPFADGLRTSALEIRRIVAMLGFALPVLCGIYGVFQQWLPTISHHYYTPVLGAFVAILAGLGIAMFAYRGYDHWDNRAGNFAALCAAGVALFPTSRGNWKSLPAVADLLPVSEGVSNTIHGVSACALFLTFYFFSAFLFTRRPLKPGTPPTLSELVGEIMKTKFFVFAPNDQTPEDREDDLHRRCAAAILLAIIGVAIWSVLPSSKDGLGLPVVAILETVAIWAFAVSWLAKNRTQSNIIKLAVQETLDLAKGK